MAVVKLLVLALETLSHWWKGKRATSKAKPLYPISLHHLSIIGKFGWFLVRGGQHNLPRDIEVGIMSEADEY